jgi:hypothetical protein
MLVAALVAALLAVPIAAGPAGAGPGPAGPNPTGPVTRASWPYASSAQFPKKGGTATAQPAPTSPRGGEGSGGPRGGPESGPCPNGVGELNQPTSPVQPGALFTPATDGFVGRTASAPGSPRAVYHAGSGTPAGTGANPAAQFRHLAGGEQLRVQAHFWDDWVNGPQVAMVRVWLESLTSSASFDYPFWTFPFTFHPQFKCYADDTNPGSNKFYFDWWVPVPAGIAAEPGFNVRVEVLGVNGAVLYGADQNSLHVGPPPTSPGQQVPAALALALDDGAVVDTHGGVDDAESVLREQLVPAVTDFLAGLDGSSSPLRNSNGEQKGSFNISRFAFTPPQLDLSLRPTSTSSVMAPGQVVEDCWHAFFGFVGGCWSINLPGGPVPSGPPDDEHRLWITARLPHFDMHGNVSWSPIGADYHISGDLTVTLSVAFDVDAASGGLSVAPDVRVEDVAINLGDDLWIDIWQWFYDLIINENKLENLIRKLVTTANRSIPALANSVPALATAIDGAVRTAMFRLDAVLAGGLSVGAGGFGLSPLQFRTTCEPLGCDGFRAGNIGLWAQGLDLAVNTGATNLGDGSRYPRTYDPQTGATTDQVHTRTGPNGQPFDVGLWVDAALVNQILTAVGSSGILDASTDLGGTAVSIRGEVAPMLVPTAQLGLGSPEGRPFTILWPNVQVDVAGARFAVDVAVGVDATVDGSSGHLVPSAAVALNIKLLRCPGLELVCGLVANSALLDQFEQWLGDGVIRPLLSNSIGQVAIPQVLGIRVDGASVASVQGNLAAFVDLAPVPTLGVRLTPVLDGGVLQQVVVEAEPAWYPGSGPYQVEWLIRDGHGTVIYQSPPGGEPNLERSFWALQLSPVDDGCVTSAGIDVQVTVSRSGWTRQAAAADTWFWWTPGSNGTCQ